MDIGERKKSFGICFDDGERGTKDLKVKIKRGEVCI